MLMMNTSGKMSLELFLLTIHPVAPNRRSHGNCEDRGGRGECCVLLRAMGSVDFYLSACRFFIYTERGLVLKNEADEAVIRVRQDTKRRFREFFERVGAICGAAALLYLSRYFGGRERHGSMERALFRGLRSSNHGFSMFA